LLAKLREEVLNVTLALLLTKRGIVAAPEQVLSNALQNRRAMPDVLVDYLGLRVAIEGKVGTGLTQRKAALAAARNRVESGLAHMAVAVLYPSSVVTISQLEQLAEQIGKTTLKISVVTEAEDARQLALPIQGLDIVERRQSPEWVDSDVNNLADVLRRAYENLVAENVVDTAVGTIRSGIDGFSPVILSSPGAIERSKAALGIRSHPRRNRTNREEIAHDQ
jgi:hypothetical protein